MKGLIVCLSLFLTTNLLKAQSSYSKIISITTTVDEASSSITLKWQSIPTASGYTVSKKIRNSTTWTVVDSSSSNSDTTFTDIISNKLIGYEYQIVTVGANVVASGYVYAAINLPPNHYNGRLILLVDSAYVDYCKVELQQFIYDIIKDGWTCSVKVINRTTPVPMVKQAIKTLYLEDTTNTKGVFILGHIAIPYSGIIYPDGHPDHQGAWPADCYYADTTFPRWTDSTVNITSASRAENKNVPGDGKYDQWSINANNVRMFVTRVDLFDMPDINRNDSLLIKKYLIKDHAYRSRQDKFRMRALVDDNFGYFNGEAFAQNGYRNGANLLGKDSVLGGDYFASMNSMDNSYLWSYGCGSGSYTSASGIGSTSTFSTSNVKSVFTMMFGSYFGDWDNTNNFLRAPLASNSSVLTNCWAGRPNWFFHAMGLGEYIGQTVYSHMKRQASYIPTNYGSNFIHAQLLGDPTLRMYLYEPPHSMSLTNVNNTTVNVSWAASGDLDVTGYYVYRTKSLSQPFSLINTIPTSGLSFDDSTATPGKNIYMIRAVKNQKTVSSGTFNNLSEGIIDSIVSLVTLPVKLIDFSLEKNECDISLTWKVANEVNIRHYELLFSTDGINYALIGKIEATRSNSYNSTHEDVCVNYQGKFVYYKLKMVDKNGSFVFSNVITAKIKNVPKITIYENPVSDYLTIKGLNKTGSIRIVSVSGEILFQKSVSQEIMKINAAFLKSGMYYLQYIHNNDITALEFLKK